MKFHILDIKKNPEGLSFQEQLDLKASLMERNAEILDLSPVDVQGVIRYEADLYFLEYQMTYTITLASSRSMEPVLLEESQAIQEIFVANEQDAKNQTLIEEDLVLLIEKDELSLDESVADNILMNIPLKVLTPEEASRDLFPQGKEWTVLSQEEYESLSQENKEANSPFAGLQGLFDSDPEEPLG
ncbi:YceD family protein [Streptococcus sp. DD13]|uniref:YceD family protein n=1 Tax=Streptococcus sp. DD13 TaxID=1777881 RepID=UPI0007939702|nr:YceD family protein [Streptococcus sp. DD13]KXT78214.1 hypothetical protein STRDD13_00932 [Streptococcus sp. DD13]